MPLMGETGQQGGGLMPLEAVSLPWPEEVIHNLYQPRTCPRERLKTDAWSQAGQDKFLQEGI